MSYEEPGHKYTMRVAAVAKYVSLVIIIGGIFSGGEGRQVLQVLWVSVGTLIACAAMITGAIGRAHRDLDQDMGIVIKKMKPTEKP